MGLSHGLLIAAPGVLLYFAVLLLVGARITSSSDLAVVQVAAIAATLVALHFPGAFGVLVAAPTSLWLAAWYVRGRRTRTAEPSAA